MNQSNTQSLAAPEFSQRIRRTEVNGVVYFSLVDIMGEFSDTISEGKFYWRDTKKRLEKDGFQLCSRISQLKLVSTDGKKYATDCADAETCMRIVQSIPSPKAEPIRAWLAQQGVRALEAIADPEQGINRSFDNARKVWDDLDRDDMWKAARIQGIISRRVFTDCLHEAIPMITGMQYAIATNAVYQGAWNGRTAKDLSTSMGLEKGQNLRDHQPTIALHIQGIIEAAVAQIIGNTEYITFAQVTKAIKAVAIIIAKPATDLGELLGMDIATGQPLLPS